MSDALEDIMAASMELAQVLKKHNIKRSNDSGYVMIKMDRTTGQAFEKAVEQSPSLLNSYRPEDMCSPADWLNVGKRRMKIAGIWFDWSYFNFPVPKENTHIENT